MNFEFNHIFLINNSFLHDEKVKNSALKLKYKAFFTIFKGLQ